LPADLTGDLLDATLAAAATTSVNQQDLDGADHFARALDGRAVTEKIATARGRVALAHSNFDGAKHDFDAALALDPNLIEAAWGRAEADRRIGNNEEAGQKLKHVLELDPKYIPALTSLKELDADSGRWTEAEDLEKRLIATDPRAGAAAYAQLGEMFLRAGQLQDAYSAMQDCLARDPYNLMSRLNLGELLTHQRKWTEARDQLEFVRRFFPDGDAETYSLLYEVYQELGDSSAAAKAVRFGLRIFPDDPDLQHLARSL
jgi:tetratricopeptide (TPR) repeat protein